MACSSPISICSPGYLGSSGSTSSATEATLRSGFDERLHDWWPGLEDVDAGALDRRGSRVRPLLLTPTDEPPEQPWFTRRDREEELLAVARQRQDGSVAVVFKRPLPYLYLAPETFGASGVPYEASDALPLAAEPTAAAVDLVLELVETNFVRSAIVALLRSPHFRFSGGPDIDLAREAISALDAALSEARYLGELANLEALMTDWSGSGRHAALRRPWMQRSPSARELASLLEPAPSIAAASSPPVFSGGTSAPAGANAIRSARASAEAARPSSIF